MIENDHASSIDRETLLKLAGTGALGVLLGAISTAPAKAVASVGAAAKSGGINNPMNLSYIGKGNLAVSKTPILSGAGTMVVHFRHGQSEGPGCTDIDGKPCDLPKILEFVISKDDSMTVSGHDEDAPEQSKTIRGEHHLVIHFQPKKSP